MTRRTFWFGLLLVSSQLSAGCCHHRCGWWRFRCCGPEPAYPAFTNPTPVCGPACGPAFGAACGPVGCPSCYTPSGDAMAHAGPMVAPPVVPYTMAPPVQGYAPPHQGFTPPPTLNAAPIPLTPGPSVTPSRETPGK